MTPLRWIIASCTSATTGLTGLALLPIVGYTSTPGLWLTYLMIGSGLTTVATCAIAGTTLTPPHAPTAPQEPPEPQPPVVTARVIRPALERPVLALPAGGES